MQIQFFDALHSVHRLRFTALLSVSLALSACAAIPRMGPAPQPMAATELANQRSFTLPENDWPAQDWWESFDDPQFDRLMDEALEHSPTMAEARARLQDATARAAGARAALYPKLSANASAADQKLSYNSIFPVSAVPHGWNELGQATLDFDWELDFWGKNRSALRAAVSDAEAADAEAAGAKLMLTTALADAYIHLQCLFDLRDVAAETLGNRTDSSRLAQARLREGLDTQVAVEEAAARVDLAQANLAQTDEEIKLTRNSIAALLGRGPDRGLDIARPALSTRRPVGLPSTLSADLLGRKPEVLAARWRVEAAAKRVGVARAAFYPNVNLVAFIGYQSLGLSKLVSSGSDIGSAGPALHLPLFEGGALRASYRGARAQYDLAVATYDEALTQALHETADAARSLEALTERQVATDAALARAEKAYSLAKARYQGGLADYQTVLTAEDIVLQARVADTAIHSRGYSLDVALIKALGGGFESDSTFQAKVTP